MKRRRHAIEHVAVLLLFALICPSFSYNQVANYWEWEGKGSILRWKSLFIANCSLDNTVIAIRANLLESSIKQLYFFKEADYTNTHLMKKSSRI